jgi:hypothetical protein
MSYRRHRLDASHKLIENALWQAGWTVLNLSQSQIVGCPDLLIAKAGRTVLCEIKTGKAELRPDQAQFLHLWPGETMVLRSVEDVLLLNRRGTGTPVTAVGHSSVLAPASDSPLNP